LFGIPLDIPAAAANMPTALYTLAYEDFQYYYTLYCQETGAQQQSVFHVLHIASKHSRSA
jgi:hypothetical protein